MLRLPSLCQKNLQCFTVVKFDHPTAGDGHRAFYHSLGHFPQNYLIWQVLQFSCYTQNFAIVKSAHTKTVSNFFSLLFLYFFQLHYNKKFSKNQGRGYLCRDQILPIVCIVVVVYHVPKCLRHLPAFTSVPNCLRLSYRCDESRDNHVVASSDN